MKLENLKRANEILARLEKLNKMQKWLHNNDNSVCIIPSATMTAEVITISEKMRKKLIDEALTEFEQLQAEFESL